MSVMDMFDFRRFPAELSSGELAQELHEDFPTFLTAARPSSRGGFLAVADRSSTCTPNTDRTTRSRDGGSWAGSEKDTSEEASRGSPEQQAEARTRRRPLGEVGGRGGKAKAPAGARSAARGALAGIAAGAGDAMASMEEGEKEEELGAPRPLRRGRTNKHSLSLPALH